MTAGAAFHPDQSLACRILVTGGHEHACGGLEAFITRARQCLGIEHHQFTDTPGYDNGGLRGWLRAMYRFWGLLGSHDLVWLNYGSAFDLAFLVLAKLRGKPVAVTPHLGGNWRTMRNTVLRTLCNRLLFLADAVFTLYDSQPQALQFPYRLTRRCTAMGTFLPQAALEAGAKARVRREPLKLVHVARMSAEKGSFAFLDVCEVLRARGVAFDAVMAGQANDTVHAALSEAIERRNLPVRIIGALAPDAFLDLLRRQDVLVNLSLQDAYPLTVIEALLCGVAPVCTALPGTRDLAGEVPAVALVEGQDAIAAADRIQSIDWAALPAAASVLRLKFGWAGLARRYRDRFRAITANRACSRSSLQTSVP